MRNYRKYGSFFWNELRASPVYDEKGRLVNFVGVQNDILGRRKGEVERDLLLLGEQPAREEAAKRRPGLLADEGSRLRLRCSTRPPSPA